MLRRSRSGLRAANSAGGIRTHDLELMRLARTAAPLPREVWLAGVEPAISGTRSRWGGQLPYSQARSALSAKRTSGGGLGEPRGSPSSHPLPPVAPAGVEPAPSRVRAGSSAIELRGRDVAGRDRTCGAPRFRRALYRLSYGHMLLCERRRGNLPVPPDPFHWSLSRTSTTCWEEGLASLNRCGALRPPTGAIRCPSARLPATVVDRQGDALSP